MTKRMLIDAAHTFETRVAVLDNTHLEEFDFDSDAKTQIKGNIYLAKVTRVEPSLQACFVDYGGNRHGFLAFSEIHPDYFQIPVADRQKLMAEVEAAEASEQQEATQPAEGGPENASLDEIEADVEELTEKRRARFLKKLIRSYRIQEVIKKNQIMLIQVNKEERGNKGAALTTYLSLAGKYCVLMPNTANGGGVSRKIAQGADRKKLKSIIEDLGMPNTMSIIIRTAGAKCTKAEIKRDHTYLIKTWDQIREDTLKASAPALIYQEADLIKQAIRDVYTKEIEEVVVQGSEGFKAARNYMKMLMPSHLKRVVEYTDENLPLFQKYNLEGILQEIHSPTVQLRSGGYIVINPTEALVSIDVNSGRATKERDIEKTALRTNIEAAEEAARQMRLRDLSGLVVIDFIDMISNNNNRKVEKAMRDALRRDRARVQVSRISDFGLMEISRQRLRPSITDMTMETCPACQGIGRVRSVGTIAIEVIRKLEQMGQNLGEQKTIRLRIGQQLAITLLNRHRRLLTQLEDRFGFKLDIQLDATLFHAPYYSFDEAPRIQQGSSESGQRQGGDRSRDRDRGDHERSERDGQQNQGQGKGRRDRRGRRGRRGDRDDRQERHERHDRQDRGHHNNGPHHGQRGDQQHRSPHQEGGENRSPQPPAETKSAAPEPEPKSTPKPAAAPKAEVKAAKPESDKPRAPRSKKSSVDEKVEVVSGRPDKPKRGWWGRNSA